MTKYEKARIIGLRAEQIGNGSPICVDPKGETDTIKIARMELQEHVIPSFIIRRFVPNDKGYEDWDVRDLIDSRFTY